MTRPFCRIRLKSAKDVLLDNADRLMLKLLTRFELSVKSRENSLLVSLSRKYSGRANE